MKRMTQRHVPKRRLLYVFAAIFVVALCVAMSCGDTSTRPNPYEILVTTPGNLNEYDPGQTVRFNIRLTKGGNPVADTTVGVNDPMTPLCGMTPRTDTLGNTHYEATAGLPGQYGFGFWSPDGQEFENYVVFIRETAINDSFHVMYDPDPPTLSFGPNQSETKETFSQKAGAVAIKTITDGIINPVFLGTGLLCLGGIAAVPLTGGVSAAVSSVACPVAVNVFMGNLLIDVTRNSIEKFVDDPVQKERGLRVFQAIDVAQSVMFFNDALVDSPKRGLALPAYQIESRQGRAAAERALTRMTDVQQSVNTINDAIADLNFINDSAFVLSMYLPESSLSEDYDQCRVVTIGIGKIQSGGEHVIDVSGSWFGQLTQPSHHGHTTLYTYAMNLTQLDSAVTGTTRIVEVPHSEYYAVKTVTGYVSGNQLFFHETGIDSQRVPIFYHWVLLQGELAMNEFSDALDGFWRAEADSGAINLVRQQ